MIEDVDREGGGELIEGGGVVIMGMNVKREGVRVI